MEKKKSQLNRFTARYTGFGIKGFRMELVKGEKEGREEMWGLLQDLELYSRTHFPFTL